MRDPFGLCVKVPCCHWIIELGHSGLVAFISNQPLYLIPCVLEEGRPTVGQCSEQGLLKVAVGREGVRYASELGLDNCVAYRIV